MAGIRITVTRSGRFKLDDSPLHAAVNEGARAVRNVARRLVRANDKSGREYTRPRGEGRQKYRAAAPGEPPARYTGELADKIQMVRAKKGRPRIVAYAIAKSPHAHLQEFGTKDMPAHPFMGPAVNVTRANNFRNIKVGANQMLRQSAKASRRK